MAADAFFRNLQRLLVEGDFASTYKFALLLSVTRWAVEHPEHGEGVPVDCREFAPYFAELYWPQVQPFGRGGRSGVLKHDPANGLPNVLRALVEVQKSRARSLADLPVVTRDQLLARVRRSIREMPLWRLQKLRGHGELPFLYRRGASASEVVFEPGIVRLLAGFAPMIEQIVRAAWLGFIARHNKALVGTPAAQLEQFLFPGERAGLDRFREALLPVQGERCFYCAGAIRGDVHVDHFLPWSLYARDLGHNFVLAHADCNQAKRDHLAAVEHLERWCRRNQEDGERLVGAFDRVGLPHDLVAVRGAATSFYGIAAATGSPVWRRGKEMVPLAAGWQALLAG